MTKEDTPPAGNNLAVRALAAMIVAALMASAGGYVSQKMFQARQEVINSGFSDAVRELKDGQKDLRAGQKDILMALGERQRPRTRRAAVARHD